MNGSPVLGFMSSTYSPDLGATRAPPTKFSSRSIGPPCPGALPRPRRHSHIRSLKARMIGKFRKPGVEGLDPDQMSRYGVGIRNPAPVPGRTTTMPGRAPAKPRTPAPRPRSTDASVVAPVSLDDVDRKIIGVLQRDGRCPYGTIAKQVGLSEAAVR
ncbi:MAG TPA: AsnC family transcriptional regulator, partial [Acidimicrobiales bacterium]|nr:AsnC family transcriptional regulator [Acidimicrobiales bacterium]